MRKHMVAAAEGRRHHVLWAAEGHSLIFLDICFHAVPSTLKIPSFSARNSPLEKTGEMREEFRAFLLLSVWNSCGTNMSGSKEIS